MKMNKLVGIDNMKEWKTLGLSEEDLRLRRTGRTTAQAFKYIGEALENPGERIEIRDHHPNQATHHLLFKQVRRIIGATELRCMVLRTSDLTIMFDLWR